MTTALKKITSLLKPNGVIAIHDTNEEDEFESNPDLPELRKLYHALSEEHTDGKRKSHCLKQTIAIAPELNLKIVLHKQCAQKIQTNTERDLFLLYAHNTAILVSQFYNLNVNQEKFSQELKIWREDNNSWVKLTGGSWLVLKKKS